MQYADISEAWNSPLSNQIRKLENNNINQDVKIETNTGSIIPAWGSHSEPIDEYLRKHEVSFNKDNFDDISDDESYYKPSRQRNRSPTRRRKSQNSRTSKPELIERIIEKPIIYNAPKEKDEYRENICDRIENHINKCRYCYNKYNKNEEKNNNFVITMDYKNMLLTLVCFFIVVFIMYYAMKK
jgi:hypothetical protein